jgi:ribonuclease P protein component
LNKKLTPSFRKWSTHFRLSGRKAFSVFFDKASFVRLKTCGLFYCPNDVGHPRLGITIKCRCSSVERVALKRTIREAFRKNAKLSIDYNVLIQEHRVITKDYLLELRRNLEMEWSRGVSTKQS